MAENQAQEAVDAVAAAIRQHRVQYLDQWICGSCQRTFANIKDADAHVAAVVVEALELREEVDSSMDYDFGSSRRYTTPWVSVVRGTTQ